MEQELVALFKLAIAKYLCNFNRVIALLSMIVHIKLFRNIICLKVNSVNISIYLSFCNNLFPNTSILISFYSIIQFFLVNL